MSVLCLELYRSVPRYLAARAVGDRLPGLLAGPLAPLRLVHRDEPEPPAEGWMRVRPLMSGICGSDLSTISGGSSFYFSALVSMPFVPGHEVVGEIIDDAPGLTAGTRVVIDPVLSCVVRGIEPPCQPCASGNPGLCERVTGGHVGAGIQTGYCCDSGGGWSQMLVAHSSQFHPVPQDLPDEAAVMIEPMACAVHAVKKATIGRDSHVLVVGAGTVGLLTLIALNEFAQPRQVSVVAKYPAQAELALRYGATEVLHPDEAVGAIRRSTRAFRLDPERAAPFLLGGVDVAFECAGARSSLDLALRVTKAGGRVVLSGMPVGADLSPAWFRELEIVGSYSGAGAFEEAIGIASRVELGKLVSAAYPLANWRAAIDHALTAGPAGAMKIVFDPRLD